MNLAFNLLCAFIASYFLRVTARSDLLGALHLDLLLAAATAGALFFKKRRPDPIGVARGPHRAKPPMEPVAKRLVILAAYVFLTLPFVEWPGSVLGHGLQLWGKSICFFFFVIGTVDSLDKLKRLMAVYVFCQVFRVLEPVYMHLVDGYWGSVTSISGWEYMDRLSGSPYDTINPNGLGFVIATTLPMLHYLIPTRTKLLGALYVTVVVLMLYALVLSASRSGFLATALLGLITIWRSKNRAALLTLAVVGCVVGVSLMNDLQRDRYLSIVSSNARSSATAEGRVSGVIEDLEIAMRRPLFGHGLGTSKEANAHFRNEDRPSHDLFTEVAQELGFIGLGIFLSIIWGVIQSCIAARAAVAVGGAGSEQRLFLSKVAESLLVLVGVDLFFSIASYGMSEPYWYFIGGLAVVTSRLSRSQLPTAVPVTGKPAALPAARSELRPRGVRS